MPSTGHSLADSVPVTPARFLFIAIQMPNLRNLKMTAAVSSAQHHTIPHIGQMLEFLFSQRENIIATLIK
jgi:hypothetical protein